MALTAKTIRAQLSVWKPLMSGLSLNALRRGQNKIGELMERKHRDQIVLQRHRFEQFDGAWILPKDERREGVILYLHGGGYTCGGLEYAEGFGSMLAVQCGVRVFCAAYRLAPEYPFPCALEDVAEAYEYLLEKGYSSIVLCGESAGGGLCYSLCMKLREENRPMPCGIMTISPWVDLTLGGESYESNQKNDPTLSKEVLETFARMYAENREDARVSPIFADLCGMPPSLIFAGSDEILLSDAQMLHRRLTDAQCLSRLIVAKERWHAYLLYGLSEDRRDFSQINKFLNQVMTREKKLRWMPLDNAAKIYPAARRAEWSNVFRESMTLTEEIDREIMQSALDVTVRRFPSIAVKLKKGMFWYYLEQLTEAPRIGEESSYPLTRMNKEETRQCALRVIVYKKRVAVEIFHSLTDGNGALIFLKTLTAEYLWQKYGVQIPAEKGVLDRLKEPSEAEVEDSYLKYAGSVEASRRENTAWKITGTREAGGFLNLTCFEMPVRTVLEKAHEYNVSLTNFLCAVLMMAVQNMQEEKVPERMRRKPVKVLIPVNLRSLFPSETLRNFALYTTPEILPKLGRYSFEEICQVVKHQMGMDITPKQMSMKIATNVNSEKLTIVKMMPLFVKNFVMKLVFDTVGERKSCFSLSNLGAVRLPDAMMPYVERMDFILGVQASAPYNCGVLSFKDTLYMNFIRNIRESELEYHVYKVLREAGIPVTVQSNTQGK